MKITRAGRVYQLGFLPRVFPVNCYLVEEEDGLTLIDAALPYAWRNILQTAESIARPIRRIVLTHPHVDHTGALKHLTSLLPDVPVLVSKRDARLLAGDFSLDDGEPNLPIRGGFDRSLLSLKVHPFQDGERIGSLLAIAAPGHTPGHTAFYEEREGILIAGDAFQTRGGAAVSGMLRPLFPFPAWATWSKQKALESACKLSELDLKWLAVGHGQMLADPLPAMRKAIDAATRAGVSEQ
ncbi:MBL fold metallo-hydrolase [Insulibacter thermoxylanivorax]|uniref:MBL fold metallo-hydrolase n=1 Tax=Insulibacter thermoxylanivorax TaxID=2749268 RepID=A0A916QE83_9BACL|nr:MBL fold metallo-hydrolase [Insulibacter thermoxylanivorax]GFR37979.1 MBL fold metallo-hydrolase [Insulibacter thermoxylanivorax]